MEQNKEVIEGRIESYIYTSEDSLYKVAKILSAEEESLIIVGNFPYLEEGLNYEFTGIFKQHPKYGNQFVVSSFTKSNHYTKDGLIAYLSSERFYGIGPKLATNIVEHLGLDCIPKILKDDTILDEVSQMTASKKKILVTALKENDANEQVFIRLYGFGLTGKMVYKLYEVYGLDAANKIEENPYRLIYDVEGFGFRKCDQLARNLGFEETDPCRLKEALRYTLYAVCYQQGFTFLTEGQLLQSALGLLQNQAGLSVSLLKSALDQLIENQQIIFENERYYDPFLYQAEAQTAKRLLTLKKAKFKSFSKEKTKEAIDQAQQDLNIRYTDLQKEAVYQTLTNKISIITGGPGTGKSTIVNGILRAYASLNGLSFPSDELDAKVVLMAPTGRAAKRLTEISRFKASTIHKALGYNYEGGFSYSEDCPLNVSLAIIDEASMIDIKLARSLFSALPLSCQIVLVGDENQLPSVGPGNVFHDLLSSRIFKTVSLFQVMRQAEDSDIIRLSSMVLSKEIDFRIFSRKKEVYFYPCEIQNLQERLFFLLDGYLKNHEDLHNGIQILIPMYAGLAGIDAVNEAVSKRYNPNEEKIVRDDKILKKHDKVLQLKNDPELNIMNGDIGKILEITTLKEKDVLLIDFDGRVVCYPVKEIEHLRLAYAISVHKSQGSEYDCVILPILPSYSLMLRQKIIYTAITRAKKKLIILGSLDTLRQTIQKEEVLRQTSLVSRLMEKDDAIRIFDDTIPFDTLGEYDMENITPYSFME